jgi:osmotically inducible protein OsmC
MPTLATISATTIGGRDGHGETSDSRVKADFNSKGQGVTPEHLFALGYSACFGSALSGVSRLKKVQLPADFSVTVKVDLNVGENHDYSLAAELQVKLPGMEKSQAEELVKAADQMCPYSKAIRGNVPVKLTVL